MKCVNHIILIVFVLMLASCSEYTPKPRGYFRIEIDKPVYRLYSDSLYPCTFEISQAVVVDSAFPNRSSDVCLYYPELNVYMYGRFHQITLQSYPEAVRDSRLLVSRTARYLPAVSEQYYSNAEQQVYGSVFFLDEESVSPVQFILTDSCSRFFHGVYYYNTSPVPDSIAPVAVFLKREVVSLVQSFRWK